MRSTGVGSGHRRAAAIGVVAAALAAVAAPPAVAASLPAAAGAPGVKQTFSPADKHGFGTAAALRSRVWFTLRSAELTEVYFPDAGTPSLRTLQFAVRDGRRVDFEARDGRGAVTRLEESGLGYRQTVRADSGRWTLTKTYVTDPARDVLLVDVRLTGARGLELLALTDPSLSNDGDDDRGSSPGDALAAHDGRLAAVLAGSRGLERATSGYAGTPSDPWRGLARRGRLARPTDARRPGNVRGAAQVRLRGGRATLALGFGQDVAGARRAARSSLRDRFGRVAAAYGAGWRRYLDRLPRPRSLTTPELRTQYETSLLVLAASEDKTHRGASIASPSMPWAWGRLTVEPDRPSGPYHLVWSRDLYQVSTAQLAAGDRAAALRNLDFLLFRQQKRDGSFPQNSTVEGRERWTELQLDQVGFPLVLAWQLGAADPRRWTRLKRAADFLARTGPRTGQERWENQSGWSPATIAAEVAGLVCAADLARRNGDPRSAARYERIADDWAASVERWTATRTGPWSVEPYYLRVTKRRDPDRATHYDVGDSGSDRTDQRAEVDPSFLELVRLGVRRHDHPVVRATLGVVDAKLRVETPNGPFWHRFTSDGYGEERDGSPWDVNEPNTFRTLGRLWPIFAGERGEYELLAGRPAASYLAGMAATANDGGMIAEQVWDESPPTGRGGRRAGEGTGSATPLAWSHAQFIRLAWSLDAGRPVETPQIVARRYAGGG